MNPKARYPDLPPVSWLRPKMIDGTPLQGPSGTPLVHPRSSTPTFTCAMGTPPSHAMSMERQDNERRPCSPVPYRDRLVAGGFPSPPGISSRPVRRPPDLPMYSSVCATPPVIDASRSLRNSLHSMTCGRAMPTGISRSVRPLPFTIPWRNTCSSNCGPASRDKKRSIQCSQCSRKNARNACSNLSASGFPYDLLPSRRQGRFSELQTLGSRMLAEKIMDISRSEVTRTPRHFLDVEGAVTSDDPGVDAAVGTSRTPHRDTLLGNAIGRFRQPARSRRSSEISMSPTTASISSIDSTIVRGEACPASENHLQRQASKNCPTLSSTFPRTVYPISTLTQAVR